MSAARDVAERLRKRRTVKKVATDDGAIHVRSLSGAERKAWLGAFQGEGAKDGAFLDQYLVAMALCDENGAALYDTVDEAFDAVCDWDIELVVSPAAREVMSLSGMKKKAVDDAEKKSDASPS